LADSPDTLSPAQGENTGGVYGKENTPRSKGSLYKLPKKLVPFLKCEHGGCAACGMKPPEVDSELTKTCIFFTLVESPKIITEYEPEWIRSKQRP
jgi:hypothetical protein